MTSWGKVRDPVWKTEYKQKDWGYGPQSMLA
jgi:hypothetical protein